MTIRVSNLSFSVEQEDLKELFERYGLVRDCIIPVDRETGRKHGFGFVNMIDEETEQRAIDDLQNQEWKGRMIRVEKASATAGRPQGRPRF